MNTAKMSKNKQTLVNFCLNTAVVALFFLLAFPIQGQGNDLGILSLNELLDLEVVSVAKVSEKVTATPAAIYIITGEDLRRNNVQTIPEALRMVPGLHVYQIDANKWAMSTRGSASRFSNKMLVMIDGRTVYSPLFSGVFWDVQDTMIEDIDKIEVIRGPGGTLWGANAVNGVVNIITKDSADTQGGLVAVQMETGINSEISARYGGWLNDKISYRLYGKNFDRDAFEAPTGNDAADEWHQSRAGFRMDMNASALNKVSFMGDIYGGKSGESTQFLTPFPPFVNYASMDVPVSGGNLLGRWIRTFSKDSELILQAYYDHNERNEFFIDESMNIADLDLQHRLMFSNSLEVLWGLGYRYINDETTGKEAIPYLFSYKMNPESSTDNLFSAFLQGRLPIVGGKGALTLGTKLEHNDYTGFEWQPTGRALWNLNEHHALWGAVTRSVRTPPRIAIDADVSIGTFKTYPQYGKTFTTVQVQGNKEIDAETVYSYESGYRGRIRENIFLDISIFYNKYYGLISAIPKGPMQINLSPLGNTFNVPVQIDNGNDGETYGSELSCRWNANSWWQLTGGFTWFQVNTLNTGISEMGRNGFSENENAEYLASLISYMDLPGHFEFNSTLYYVDALDGLDIDSHFRLDLNIGWHPTDNFSVTAGGYNLFNSSHQEFSNTTDGVLASEIPQTFYTKITMTF
jgi:iron complex outermembrane receptor protein